MKYLFITLLLVASISGFSQQEHFIYIQTDNKQPFYVKMDRRILSSTVSGYLIIPKLRDSVYKLTFGFPRNEWHEQVFTCSVEMSDAGYLFKNFGEKGWGLFNLQSMLLVMSDTAKQEDMAVVKNNNKTDAFTDILSNVVNDPSIRNPVKREDDVTPAEKITVEKEKKGPVVVKKTKQVSKDKENKKPLLVRSHITRLPGKWNRNNVSRVYVDRTNGISDTVNVLIPVQPVEAKKVSTRPKTELARINKPTVKTTDSLLVRVSRVKKEKPGIKGLKNTDSLDRYVVSKDQGKKKLKLIGVDPVIVRYPDENNKTDTLVQVIPGTKRDEPVVIFERPDTTVNVQSELKKEEPLVNVTKTDTVVAVKADTVAVNQPEIKKEEPLVIVPKADTVVTVKADTVAVIQPEIKKEDPVVIAAKADTVIALKADTVTVVQPEIKKEEPLVIVPKADTVVTVKADTVTVVQPEIKKEEPLVIVPKADTVVTVKADTVAVVQPEIKKEEPVVVAILKDTIVASEQKEKLKTIRPDEKETVSNDVKHVVFTPCKEEANGDDFLGLLKKMDKAKAENEKLFIAHKAFTIRCYNTKQIERISLQFKDDSGKYKFFDDAYGYVSDREIFPRLVELLKDSYYINRFKAMLR